VPAVFRHIGHGCFDGGLLLCLGRIWKAGARARVRLRGLDLRSGEQAVAFFGSAVFLVPNLPARSHGGTAENGNDQNGAQKTWQNLVKRGLQCQLLRLRVRAALFPEAERSAEVRRRAAVRACRESAALEADCVPSRCNALVVARERFRETLA